MDISILWSKIREEVIKNVENEPILASFLHLTVLRNKDLNEVLAFQLSSKLSSPVIDSRALYEVFIDVLRQDNSISDAVFCDICAYYDRDPACNGYSFPLLYFKGFHAIETHRINNYLWNHDRETLALFLQNRSSEVFSVDIHPAAKVGKGIMLDHGTGIVIGETAVLGNNISILHGVTLGGSGKETGDRHPKIKDGVMIGANASILGNITIGECAFIGAGSVVLKDIPSHVTAVGVPAKIVGTTISVPSIDMKQSIDKLDYDI